AQQQMDLDLLVRACHDDASLERLSNGQGMDSDPVAQINLKNVSDVGLVFLARMSGIRGVSLFEAPISDDGLVNLQALTALKDLGLESTRITDAGLVHLGRLTSLKSLGL